MAGQDVCSRFHLVRVVLKKSFWGHWGNLVDGAIIGLGLAFVVWFSGFWLPGFGFSGLAGQGLVFRVLATGVWFFRIGWSGFGFPVQAAGVWFFRLGWSEFGFPGFGYWGLVFQA
jgi:hypothetical protein